MVTKKQLGFDCLNGKNVVVRSSIAGVLHGRLIEYDVPSATALLSKAQKAHSWESAKAPEGLALTGPTGGRITPPGCGVQIVHGCDQIIEASPAASKAWAQCGSWGKP